jgi:hypothetical protein
MYSTLLRKWYLPLRNVLEMKIPYTKINSLLIEKNHNYRSYVFVLNMTKGR